MREEIAVTDWIHVSKARRVAVKMGSHFGFSEKRLGEIAVIVSELADNLVSHHVKSGMIQLKELNDLGRRGIEIVSIDKGPGIKNIKLAVSDGYSERTSLGIGLGAVKRLSDEFDIYSHTEQPFKAEHESIPDVTGTIIISRLWTDPKTGYLSNLSNLRTGVMCRPMPGEKYNGDNYIIKEYDNKLLVGVIDGLGHGEEASEASSLARDIIESNYNQPLDTIMELIHTGLRKTRGAVASIALINMLTEKISYAGIGNVTCYLYSSQTSEKPVNYNGLLGNNLRKIRVFEYNWEKDSILVMFSDGIMSRFDNRIRNELLSSHPVLLANLLLKYYGRNNDDATVIVCRNWFKGE